MLPSPELRMRNIEYYWENFSRKQIAQWACDFKHVGIERPYRPLVVYCAHSTMDTHTTATTKDTALLLAQRKSPMEKNTEFCKLSTS